MTDDQPLTAAQALYDEAYKYWGLAASLDKSAENHRMNAQKAAEEATEHRAKAKEIEDAISKLNCNPGQLKPSHPEQGHMPSEDVAKYRANALNQ